MTKNISTYGGNVQVAIQKFQQVHGKEVPLKVDSSTFKFDSLFFHRGLQCLVATELKTGKFKPDYMKQIEFYLGALDRGVRRSNGKSVALGDFIAEIENALEKNRKRVDVQRTNIHEEINAFEVVQKYYKL